MTPTMPGEMVMARAHELANQVEDLVTDWPEDGYFINGDVTSFEDYCGDCIDEAFAKAKAENPGKELFIGSTCGSEQDGCLHCAACGRLIAYTLTDYGVRDELAHFEENRIGGGWNDGLGSDEFYHIARAAIGAACIDELAGRAIEICEWALSLQGFSRQAARWEDDGGLWRPA
jgi:hypothetical protein